MKQFLSGVCVTLCIFLLFAEVWRMYFPSWSITNTTPQIIHKPLLIYTFTHLHTMVFPPTSIALGAITATHTDYVSQVFFYDVPVRPGSTQREKVSGLMNIPTKPGTYPVIVMLRGFVPGNIYQPGIGTQPVASVLATHGYITLAPDFLGFGQSASPSSVPFEDRFQTYTTAATLLSSLSTLSDGLAASYSGKINPNMKKIGIWAHSNGGHIALSTLAITGVQYPTVLWAPVSTSFPYDILYYTVESDDQGKGLRKAVSQFETLYDTDQFSPPLYYSWIKAPIEIDQGTADQEVPVWWSTNLAGILQKDGLNVAYHTYPGADHNLQPSGWGSAVQNDLEFYSKQLGQ